MLRADTGEVSAELFGDQLRMVVSQGPDGSRLVQSLVGTHPEGVVMPPSVAMSPADIQKIIDWVAAGAPER